MPSPPTTNSCDVNQGPQAAYAESAGGSRVRMIDTHCHLLCSGLRSRAEEAIARAMNAGVTRLINVACVPDEWDPALDLLRRYGGQIWLAAGIHPHDAEGATDSHLARLAEIWNVPGVVACGEMGLDYHYDFSPRPVQQEVFARQLRLAGKLSLPIVIHCRNAHADAVRILLDEGYAGRRVVFHCFSGTCDEAVELRSHGWVTSFSGIVTFDKSQEQQKACASTPADEIMFETDAPYLSPEPVRRTRPNEPANVEHTVRFAARLRGELFEGLAAQSTANALRFFGLP